MSSLRMDQKLEVFYTGGLQKGGPGPKYLPLFPKVRIFCLHRPELSLTQLPWKAKQEQRQPQSYQRQ